MNEHIQLNYAMRDQDPQDEGLVRMIGYIPILDMSAQLNFAKKVYSILLCQFIVLFINFYLFDFVYQIVFYCIAMFSLHWFDDHLKLSYFIFKIINAVFTLTYSYCLGYFTTKLQNNSKYKIPFWPITILLVICLKIYADKTKYDFTPYKFKAKRLMFFNYSLAFDYFRERILYFMIFDILWTITQLIVIFQLIEGKRSKKIGKDKCYEITTVLYYYIGVLYFIFALLNSTYI